jgi:hypothetical protein
MGLIRKLERIVWLFGVLSAGYVLCVLLRECDFNLGCFQATFFS